MNTNLPLYYAERAAHYEDVYRLPQRQSDLGDLAVQLQQLVQDKKVLEVACGTGYWTERFVDQAEHVVATDINAIMLELAEAKSSLKARVEFRMADAFDLSAGDFDTCVAGFWWSHVKRSQQSAFLEGLQKTCRSGALLVMFDNCQVEGETVPIARTDAEGNTYQIRRLPDGSRHEVIKNFPTDSALRKKLTGHARDIRISRSNYYWMLTCVLR